MNLGKAGYEAYVRGLGCEPDWDTLSERVRSAWSGAAVAVVEAAYLDVDEELPATQPAPEGYPG